MNNDSLDIVGIPSTVLSWLSLFQIVTIGPLLNVSVSILSLAWLCMQIYGWIEKRIKSKNDGSE